FEECADSPDRPMVAEVYRLRPDTKSVNEMRRRKPIKTVCLAQLDITPRDHREGFPGLDMNEWFGLDIRFTVNMPQDLTMDLMLLSDDGAILTIDDVEVINNDGIHAAYPLMETVKLAKGLRNFRVRYFQGPGYGLALILGWKKPDGKDYQYIPRRLLGRPPAAAAAASAPQ
ncbi:PA14 domain-containing protein, partial [Roseateles sp. P5_E4]